MSEEQPKKSKELWEQYLADFISQCPQIEDVAMFTVTTDGIDFEMKDFTKFDITTEFYRLNLLEDPKFADLLLDESLIENIYAKVAEKCNESGEYTIDCFNGRYTCRKISEIEKIHYGAMTDEEKVKYDAEKLENAINSKRTERDELLRTEVDPIVMNPIRWGELSEDEQNAYKAYRLYLLDIPQQPEFPNIEILKFADYKEKVLIDSVENIS